MASQTFTSQAQRLFHEKPFMSSFTTLSALGLLIFSARSYWLSHVRTSQSEAEEEEALAAALNPPILKKNSATESYTTSHATYPGIRTFYHRHPQAEKLPDHGKELPLLVFIHGLGGCLAQFAPLLSSLVNIAPCFGIDMPGCGLSTFAPNDYDAYTTESLVALHKVAIEKFCEKHGHEHVVLIGHSMGCSISAMLVSNTAQSETTLSVKTLGVVAICPKSDPPTKSEATNARRLLSLPDFVLNTLRWLDRRGGPESRSVTRFVGKDAGIDLKKLQLKFNSRFPTPVWKRTALGALPTFKSDTEMTGGLPGKHIWSGVEVPFFMVAGAGDTICPPAEVTRIVSYLPHEDTTIKTETNPTTNDLALQANGEVFITPASSTKTTTTTTSPTSSHTSHSSRLKTALLPLPASHALLYSHTTYRTLAGLLLTFLSTTIHPHLSTAWQLQTLTTSGKWDVKNLAKWTTVTPVSQPIDGGLFRALKTLREQDPIHTPSVFCRTWSPHIYAVIDISHDPPIYDPSALEKGGIQYHKFSTVSKIPPTPAEVAAFIALVDRLRADQDDQRRQHRPQDDDSSKDDHDINTAEQQQQQQQPPPPKAIGVHCHYGFNRTGFFIVCYLVEKRGYGVQEAVEEFRRQRPPGIRHEHFLDELAVRYCVGLGEEGVN